MILRLYFVNGCNRIWLTAFIQTAGFSLITIVLIIAYFIRRSTGAKTEKFHVKGCMLFAATVVIGILTGLNSYLYAYGLARLPVSTSSLIAALQLAFTALFAFLMVKQKFTYFSIIAVVLLMMAAGVLAMHMSSDRKNGESKKEYVIGFVMTLGAAAMYGFIYPLVELIYRRPNSLSLIRLLWSFR